jgi:hypothetical protein
MPPIKPLFFISHKHADADVAKVFADFVSTQSGGRVRVHLSSSWEYDGPRYGNLNAELTKALWEAEALLLVYTQSDQDWSYCMYEWGVTQKSSPVTRTVLFQCADAVPAPLGNEVRYNARSDDDIRKFVNSFLTDTNFFPARAESVTEFLPHSDQVKSASQKLRDDLRRLIRGDRGSKPVALWPYLRIELPLESIEAIKGAAEGASMDVTRAIMERSATLSASNARAAQIFGKADLNDGMPFFDLVTAWRGAFSGREAGWFDALCSQVRSASQGSLPEVTWTCITQVGGHQQYLPVVSTARQINAGRATLFEIWLYDFTDVARMPVSAKMIPRAEMFALTLDEDAVKGQLLSDLVQRLKTVGRHRLPILDSAGRIKYMVHRSSVAEYLMERGLDKAITLKNLFDESPEMRNLFETSFLVVARSETLQKARTLMQAVPDCRDVFVTEHGRPDEPILGWLTNVMLI